MIVTLPNSHRASRWLASLVTAFAVLGLLAAFAATHRDLVAWVPGDTRFVQLFLMDLEHNVPTWFSAALLLAAALILMGVSQSRSGQPRRARWVALSGLFVLLSLDETVSLHEKLIPLGRSFGMRGLLSHAWIVFGAAFVAVLFLWLLPLLRSLPERTLRLFLLAAALYLGGVLVVESLGGLYAETHGYTNFPYYLITTLEESLEMTGLAIFICALLGFEEQPSHADPG